MCDYLHPPPPCLPSSAKFPVENLGKIMNNLICALSCRLKKKSPNLQVKDVIIIRKEKD